MSKRIKMVLYGEPGTGKSVFACKAPKPFFITTDGNYEWLEEFGAKEEDHIQVSSWEEMKEAFAKDYDGYETIVVDLLEDAFKWCEAEFCVKHKIEHVGDIGYAKGYDISRNDFFIEISKLFAKDKHIILISHGMDKVVKDRRGVEHTNHIPSTRIPDKLWDMIEGRVRYFLRCYMRGEDNGEGKTVKKRYLSLIPKENEYGITRGIDENEVPHDIPLDFNEFAKIIGVDTEVVPNNIKAKRAVKKAEEFKQAEMKIDEALKVEEIKEIKVEETPELKKSEEEVKVKKIPVQAVESREEVKEIVQPKVEEPKAEEQKPEQVTPTIAAQKRAEILAKLQAMSKKN